MLHGPWRNAMPLVRAPWWPNTNIADWPAPNENRSGAEVQSAQAVQNESHPLLVDSNLSIQPGFYTLGLTPTGGRINAGFVYKNLTDDLGNFLTDDLGNQLVTE